MSKFASNAAAAPAAGAGAGRKSDPAVVKSLKAKFAKGTAFLSKWTSLKSTTAPPVIAVETKLGLTTPADLAFRQVAHDHAYPVHLARRIRRAIVDANDRYVESLLKSLRLVVTTAAKCPGQTLAFHGLGSLSPAQMYELNAALSPEETNVGLYAVDRWLRFHAKDALTLETHRVVKELDLLVIQLERRAPVCPVLKKKVVFFDQDDELPDFDYDMPLYVISEAVPLPPADEHYAKAAADFCDDRIQDPFLPIFSSLDELHKELSGDLIGMNDTNGPDELAGLWWYTPNLEAETIPIKCDGNGKFSVAEVTRLLKLYSLPAAVQCNNGSMMVGFYAKPSLRLLADVATAASPMQLSE